MKYSIYYSAKYKDYLVWNNKHNYVSNWVQPAFIDIEKNWFKYKHVRGPNGFWFKHEDDIPLPSTWLFDSYPDIVLLCETNSLNNLSTQFPELCI